MQLRSSRLQWMATERTPTGQQTFDYFEIYNIPKFTKDFEGKYQQPHLLKAHLPEIEHFSKTLHSNVVLPLLRLFRYHSTASRRRLPRKAAYIRIEVRRSLPIYVVPEAHPRRMGSQRWWFRKRPHRPRDCNSPLPAAHRRPANPR